LILGIAYSWSVPMAFASQTGAIPWEAGWIFAATFFWVVGFDTIYAMGDYDADMKAGIRSIACRLGRFSRFAVAVLWCCSIVCFWKVGRVFDLGTGYTVGLAIAIGQMGWQVYALARPTPASCLRIFKSNAWLGAIFTLSVEVGLLWR